MKLLLSALSFFLISGSVYAQNNASFNGRSTNFGAFSSGNAGKIVPTASVPASTKINLPKMIKLAGYDISKFSVAKANMEAHLAILKGKAFGESPQSAIKFLGLLGCGDSALVGSSDYISEIYNSITSYYYKDRVNNQPQISMPGTKPKVVQPATIQEKHQIVLAAALIASANYNVNQKYGTKKIGESAVNFLTNVILNENDFSLRREAVMALGSIQSNAAVDAISRCVFSINQKHSRLFDEAFVFSSDFPALYDNGEGPDALLTALMLALDAQIDGAAKEKALLRMKWYAGTTGNNSGKTTYSSLDNYTEQGGNSTTYLAGLYLLAARRMIPSRIVENWNESHNRIIGYTEKMPQAMKMIRVIENKGAPFFTNYECQTRRAFLSAYKYVSGYRDSFIYQTGTRPPFAPYYFDDCMKQKTDKIMFSIIEFYLNPVGGLKTKAAKLVIKGGSRALFGYAKAQKAWNIAGNLYLKTTSAQDYAKEIRKIIQIAAE